MDYHYKQLEQELSALRKVFSELAVRLSEVAKETASPGVIPSEKVLEQISASRTSFENARTAVHSHSSAMLVSPLPSLGELISIAAMDTLLKAAAAAEENKSFIEGEREKALAILGRALSIAHRDGGEFKPLLECHAKLEELRGAVTNVLWPHRHPESVSIVALKHPANALLNFVENLDTIEDEEWIALETTISESYGKPLFVAASRGKLVVREVKSEGPAGGAIKPAAGTSASAPVKTPAPAAEKPAEKPIEKKTVAEKAPERTAPTAQTPVPAAPAVGTSAPAAAAERKVAAQLVLMAPAVSRAASQERATPRTVAPVLAVSASAPVVSSENREVVERADSAPTVAASAPAVVAAPPTPVAAAAAVPAPSTAISADLTPTPAASLASSVLLAVAPHHPAPVTAAAPPVYTAPATAPSASSNTYPTTPVAAAQNASHSLVALASATEPGADKKGSATATIDIADKQSKEPRLAVPVSHTSPRAESMTPESASEEEAQQSASGDGSQRPQRWGFWRGNR